MEQNRNPQDEKLIQSLYEKLNWFTYEASGEEFDVEQVRAILALLDVLDPVEEGQTAPEQEENAAVQQENEAGQFESRTAGQADAVDTVATGRTDPADPVAAFERFKSRYGISEEELAAKDGRSSRRTAEIGNAGDKTTDSSAETHRVKGNGKLLVFPTDTATEFAEEVSFDAQQADEMANKAGEAGISQETGRNAAEDDAAAKDALSVKKHTVSGQAGKAHRHFAKRAWARAAAGIAVVVLAVMCLEIGTSAVAEKSFFEIVRDGVNGMKITVTGNESEAETETTAIGMESEERVYYESWDEVKEEEPDILVPGYMPEGLELKELYGRNESGRREYRGLYVDQDKKEARIYIYCYDETYKKVGFNSSHEYQLLETDEKVEYYQIRNGELFQATWEEGQNIYMVIWNNIKDIHNIVDKMHL